MNGKYTSPSKEDIKKWLKINNYNPEKIDDEKYEYVFKVMRGQYPLVITRLEDKSCLQISMQFQLLKNDKHLYTKEVDVLFKKRVFEILYILDLDVRFREASFGIHERIFDSGFNYDKLHRVLRKIQLAGIRLYQILSEVVGTKEVPSDLTMNYIG